MTLYSPIILAATLVALTSLTGCGKSEKAAEVEVSMQPKEPASLVEVPIASNLESESTKVSANVSANPVLPSEEDFSELLALESAPKSMDEAKALVRSLMEKIDFPEDVEPEAAASQLRQAAEFIKSLPPVEDRGEQGQREIVSMHLGKIASQLETKVEDADVAGVLGQLQAMMQMYMPE